MTIQQAQIIHRYGDFLYGVEILEDYKPEKKMMPVDYTTAIKLSSVHDLIGIAIEIKENATEEERDEVSGVLIAKMDVNIETLKFSIVIY